MIKKESLEKFGQFHDKYYKILLIIPIVLLILSLAQIGVNYSQTGELFKKDISLTGGTTITLFFDINSEQVSSDLNDKFIELNIREIYDILTNEKKAVILETKTDGTESKKILEEYFGFELNEENSSIEFTGASLSDSFYKQLIIAVIVAFLLMGIVIFLLFRSTIPSSAVILAGLADIIMTLAVIDLLEVKLSAAGIVAFLMLIGYSVDTDILLTNRVLKRSEGSVNQRIYGAFKTGMTMTLTAITAVLIAFILTNSFSAVLSQVFFILFIGLSFDILNTWITNVSILKWHVLHRK